MAPVLLVAKVYAQYHWLILFCFEEVGIEVAYTQDRSHF